MASGRDSILDAADVLFGERGFDGTTTREIAARCGVNKALIHYHFETKERLFHEVLARYYARLSELLAQIGSGQGTVRDRLEALLDGYVDFLCNNGAFSRMLQREVSSGRHVEQIVAHMVPWFQEGVRAMEGAFPVTRGGELAASQLLVSFFGMTVTYFTYGPVVHQLLGVDPLAPEQIAARKRHLLRMLDLVLTELQTPSNPREIL